jgi:hypothetical protein
MAKFVNSDVLDAGLNYIKTNCNKLALVSAYTFGDSYSIVNANIIADAAMAPTDFTLGSSGNSRTLTASAKQDASANATGTASHVVFLDTVNSKVLWATSETTGQTIYIGNPVSFPSVIYTANQPV